MVTFAGIADGADDSRQLLKYLKSVQEIVPLAKRVVGEQFKKRKKL